MAAEEARRRILGDRIVETFVKEMMDFAESGKVLLSPEIARKYPGNWVAVFDGRVVAASPDHTTFLDLLKSSAVPPESAAIKFIEKQRGSDPAKSW